jgi:hypothetical protein
MARLWKRLQGLLQDKDVHALGRDEMFFAFLRAAKERHHSRLWGLALASTFPNQTVIVAFGPDEIVKDIHSTMGGMETSDNLSTGKKAASIARP